VDRPAIVDQEFGYERREVPVVDGQRMSVLDEGPEDAEETLLFHHGNPTWSFLWRKLVGPAIDAGHRVIAPDMIGLGTSEKPLSPAYHSLERHILNLEAMVTTLDLDELTLVLHDWGGPIGMGLATRHPDRIRRIVIANSLAFPPTSERSMSLWHKLFSTKLGRVLNTRANLAAETAFRMGARDLPDEVLDAYRWPLAERGGRIAAQRLVEMVPDGPQHPSAETLAKLEDRYDTLDEVAMLVLWADQDPVMPPRLAAKWSDAFPQADVRHVSDRARHFWQEDDPAPFRSAILDWIETTS
jgi:haloalkane dehalogenase